MPTIDLDGITMYYEDEGAGEPIILLHGFPLAAEMWTPQRAVLAADYRVISPDLRGFGGSDRPHGPLSISAYADDVVALMDQLGIGAATVGGLSMGGYITMALLRRRPDRVRAVMLLATKATPDSEEAKQARVEMIGLAESEGAEAVADKMLPRLVSDHTMQTNGELVAYLRAMMAGASVEGITAALHALRDRPDSLEVLRQLNIPALIVAGADDKLIPGSEAEKMREAIAGSRLETIAYAGHMLNLEQPESTNELLRSFLDQTFQR